MEDKGIRGAQLSRDLGISSGNISDWKAGRSTPTSPILQAIADYLNTTTAFLLGKTAEKEKAAEPGGLSPADARLLSLFHTLNAEGQARAVETLEDMVAGGRYKKDSARVG